MSSGWGVMNTPLADWQEVDALRLLGRLTAGVAHDLNNYLVVLDVSLELLDRAADHESLRHAKTAVDAAIRLTSTLLAYARGGTPEPEEVDLAALVERTLSVFRSTIPSCIDVQLALDRHTPTVRGVAPELEQVVLNLVLNAIDAMPSGGQLRIGVRSENGHVRIEVADSGRGLDQPILHESGRSRSSKDRVGGGLGLGIVTAVVERHRAALHVSPREGGGTVVAIVVPVK
jgi:signal transduction histidine kinase